LFLQELRRRKHQKFTSALEVDFDEEKAIPKLNLLLCA
jgi:hypothetical protein